MCAQANAPVLDALFADSVPTGQRAALYTRLHICYILSQASGSASLEVAACALA